MKLLIADLLIADWGIAVPCRAVAFTSLLVCAVLAGGCAAGKAHRQGDAAVRAGNLDEAVSAYRRALQASPRSVDIRIAFERTRIAASRAHLDKARAFEQNKDFEAALAEYGLASDYDPSNGFAKWKAETLDRRVRERTESQLARAPEPQPAPANEAPPPQADGGRASAPASEASPPQSDGDRASAQPSKPINPNEIIPSIHFNNASVKDVLAFVAAQTGMNVTYEHDVRDRPITVNLTDVTLGQALKQIMAMSQLSFKVVGSRSIAVGNQARARPRN